MPFHARVRKQAPAQDPRLVWGLVLLSISLVEWGLMLLLPRILPEGVPRLIEAGVDAALLFVVLAPLLWWLLLRPLQQAHQERQDFIRDLFVTIENERRATARDLHDGVGQGLTLMVARLKSVREEMPQADLLRRLAELRELAQSTLAETRRLALGLRPSLLDDLGLVPAIERVLGDLPGTPPLSVTTDLQALVDVRLPEAVESTLFRIFQEALQNVVRHAQARAIELRLLRLSASVILEVVDDGCGFSPESVANCSARHGGHMGLVGMAERAALAGGRLEIESRPGQGTSIEVELPVTWGEDVTDSRLAGR